MVTLHVQDTFLQDQDKTQFFFMWKGVQYSFNRLPQGYEQSPTIAHNAFPDILLAFPVPPGVKTYSVH